MAKESLLTKIPNNTNFLQTTKYTFTLPQMPFLRYFVQTVNLPSVATAAVLVPTPFSETYRHGDKLIFDPLNITMLADEDLYSWEETYEWLKGLTYPTKFKEYLKNRSLTDNDFPNKQLYSDAILTLNTNAHNQNIKIKFKNCHPTYLGMIQLSTMDNANIVPNFDVTFQYDYFEIER